LASVPDGWDAVREAVSLVGDDLDKTAKKYGETIDAIWEAGNRSGDPAVNEQVKTLTDLLAAQENIQAEGDTSLSGKRREQLEADLEALRESFLTEEELLLEKYEKDQMLLEEALENKLLTEEEFNDRSLRAKEDYEKKFSDIQEREAKARLQATQGALGNLSTLMNTESRKLFELGKAAALANAIISGHEAAVEAYKGGLKVSGGNPAVGAAFAAASLAATGAQISSIQSQSFGGGGAGGGGGGSVTQAINADSEQVQPVGGGEPDRNVFVQGIDPEALFSGEQILDLINNELSNGGRIVAK